MSRVGSLFPDGHLYLLARKSSELVGLALHQGCVGGGGGGLGDEARLKAATPNPFSALVVHLWLGGVSRSANAQRHSASLYSA